jgi:hypothetical protein
MDRPAISLDLFPYTPLPEGGKFIRILSLQPGKFDQPLRAGIRTVNLDEPPSYVALSYTWELAHSDNEEAHLSCIEESIKNLLLNGIKVQIQENLGLALQYLRSPSHPLDMWVDAVSIHQANRRERSAQVSSMGSIYKKAQKVIAWLGEPDVLSETAYLLKQQLLQAQDGQGATHLLAASLVIDKPLWQETTKTNFEPKSALHIAKSRYWTRMWIIQEMALARELLFAYGSFLWTTRKMDQILMIIEPYMESDSVLSSIKQSFTIWRTNFVAIPIEGLVERFMTYGCSEIRDRIYSLSEIASNITAINTTERVRDPVRNYFQTFDLDQDELFEPERGMGYVRIDYEKSLYDLWADMVQFTYFRSNETRFDLWSGEVKINQPDGSLVSSSSTFLSTERKLLLIRNAAMFQWALGQKVKEEVDETHNTNVSFI